MSVKRVNVLSIEDNPGNAHLIKVMLSEASQIGWDLPRFELEQVKRLGEGLARLDQGGVDVVLLDLDLPDSWAGETFATVHAHAPNMPIVVLTGREDEDLAAQTVRAGAQDYLFKREMSGSLLAHALIYAIERQRAKEALQRAHDDLEQRVKERTQALRQSERELQLTLDATTDGIWKWNFQTDELTFSPRYYAMLGYEPDEFPATYESWRDLIHPDDRERALSAAEEYLATKPDLYENEFRLRTKSGAYRWIQTRARVVERDENGEVVRMIGHHQDITERMWAEQALQKSEANLVALIESTDDIIVSRDRQGRALVFNSGFARIVRQLFDIEAQPGVRTMDYLPEAQKRHWEGVLEKVYQGASHREEFTWELGGETRRYALSLNPIWAGDEIIGSAEFSRDVTERVRAGQALRESQRLLKSVFQSLQEAVFILDADTAEIVDCNPAVEEIFGYERGELLGRTTAFLHVDQTTLEEFRAHLYPAVSEQGFLYLPRFRMKRKSGEVFISEHYVMPLMGKNGHQTGWVSVVRDITERVRAEQALLKGNRELELLNQVIGAAASSLNLERIFQTACRELAHIFDVPQAAATLLNEAGTALNVVAEYREPGQPGAQGVVIPLKDNPASVHVLENQTPLAIIEAQTDERQAAIHDLMRRRGTASLLIVPIVADDEAIGTIGLDAAERREFSQEEIGLAQSVAMAVGQAVAVARLHQELERYAATLEERVARRTAELNKLVNAMAGREVRMAELKKVIRELRQQIQAAGLTPSADDPLAAWRGSGREHDES